MRKTTIATKKMARPQRNPRFPNFADEGFQERDYGVAWSIYTPDPDGHPVEITTDEVTRG